MVMQPLREITLTATENNWRLFMVRKADPAFLKFQEKIFIRDNYTCQFCGFCAKYFQETVNIDGNYLNNKSGNLATACSFCAQCFFLEFIGKNDFGGGHLIFLPEMSQGELNALCHVLFNSIALNSAYAAQANNLYRSMKLRTQQVEKELGEGLSSPAVYGHMLLDANIDNKEDMHKLLKEKLRVLPNLKRFSQQIETWVLEGLERLTF